MRTQVAIIGAGPAGLLLSEILHHHGVESVVLEKRSREHLLGRVRAGVLDQVTVDVLRTYGLAERLDRESLSHGGVRFVWADSEGFFLDVEKLTGKPFTTYGQTEIQRDLFAAADRRKGAVVTNVSDVRLENVESKRPHVSFSHLGTTQRLDCEFIAGCDGFHGVSRTVMAKHSSQPFVKHYPFAWLSTLAHAPPIKDITYARHNRGFALASSRSTTLSRYYIQVPADTRIEDWSDDRFWTELKVRYPPHVADAISPGPSVEKSIIPLRSDVMVPMRYGRLFLAGDAAHILPPTGAKGLNLAVSDVYRLAQGLIAYFSRGSAAILDCYSEKALRRVWSAVRLSSYLITLLHKLPGTCVSDERLQELELEHLGSSFHAQAALAEQYAGQPLEMN
jgi:p-hydroxybenzoate 3-monooxygenase